MACFSGAALFGTGLGPLVCGFIAHYTTWRWIFYMQIIIGGLISVADLLFREARAPVILRKKAKLLNKWYEDLEAAGMNARQMPSGEGVMRPEKHLVALRIRWKVAADDERANPTTMLRTSLLRRFQLVRSLYQPVGDSLDFRDDLRILSVRSRCSVHGLLHRHFAGDIPIHMAGKHGQ